VSDQDLNFYPPERREAKKAFEPPPWEQEQFNELARRKEAEKTAAAIAAGVTNEGPVAAGISEERPLDAPSGELARTEDSTPKAPVGTDSGSETDPRVEAMLLGLRHEDPPFGKQLWKVAMAAGAVLALVGTVLTVWGVVAVSAARRTGALSALGGGVLVVFGLGFIGVGGWMAFRTLRQQGVL
jgi:hypothetical protein